MAVNLVVAVTDYDWFQSLKSQGDLAEVNFWAPSGANFRALRPGELFLFKLHSPRNFIAGGGIFTHSMTLPCSLAWETFGTANGAASFMEMRARIAKYRKLSTGGKQDFAVGCRILTQPFFKNEFEWLPVPESWSKNIVTFKTYSTDTSDGRRMWEWAEGSTTPQVPGFSEQGSRFGEPTLIRPRLGQGAFRVLVTDAYGQRCAVTRERTLPALEAGHIRPYSEGGQHMVPNGMLLRRDIHTLFDLGYVTVTPEHRFEVSQRIREEFENGRDYYALHGRNVAVPEQAEFQPDRLALEWHNNEKFQG